MARIEIRLWLAQRLGVTTCLEVEAVHAQTDKAVMVTAHAVAERRSSCSRCGRELTHPVSVLLGIGPVCGSHFHIPPAALADESGASLRPEVLEALRVAIESVRVEKVWIPRSAIIAGNLEDVARDEAAPATRQAPDALIDVADGRAIVTLARHLPSDRWAAYKAACDAAGFRSRKNAAGKWEQTANAAQIPALIEGLKAAGFRVNGTRAAHAAAARATLGAPTHQPAEADEAAARAQNAGLYAFQAEGAAWLASRNAALLGDQMGLGKTVQILAAL